MTNRPAYFVVAKRHGVEYACIVWDELPRAPIPNLVYLARLDTMPNADALGKLSTDQLLTLYRRLRNRGNLPSCWEPPPKPRAQPAERLIGYREEITRPWDSSTTAYPTPADIERMLR
jgi:hypothetical protein